MITIAWRAHNLRHLVTLVEELNALGVSFISLNEGIDFGTAAGKLQFHVLAALSEFERSRIIERVRSGIARARGQGKRFGRPVREIPEETLAPVRGLSVREAAKRLGVSPATAHRWLRRVSPNP
jgi:DNA invertase Pin-like site-specific DNA recombinase